jgi:hypothetical protein
MDQHTRYNVSPINHIISIYSIKDIILPDIESINITSDFKYSVVLLLNDACYWMTNITLAKIYSICAYLEKPLPSKLMVDNKTKNFISRYSLDLDEPISGRLMLENLTI